MLRKNSLSIISIGLFSVVIAISCAHKTTPASTKANETKVSSANTLGANDNAKEMMVKGEEIYRTKCTRCHGVPETSAYSSNRWDRIINEMAPKARLDVTEKNAVLMYVKGGAR